MKRARRSDYLPDAYVSVSSEVLPEFREYERLSTTVRERRRRAAHATLSRPVPRARAGARHRRSSRSPSIRNGGLMSVRTVRSFPVRTCLSGSGRRRRRRGRDRPRGGFPNLVTFDVGGTSTDVSLIHDGQPLFSSHRDVADYPVKTPMIDIHVIGAGGGSIAWIDDAGVAQGGSAQRGRRARPGRLRARRRRADDHRRRLALQRLNPVALLDGRMPVDARPRAASSTEQIAQPLGLSARGGGRRCHPHRQREHEPRDPLGLHRARLRPRRVRAVRLRRRRPAARDRRRARSAASRR